MRVSSKFAFALVLGALLVPVFSQAAQLTQDQINAVLGLLQSFNVEAKTVATVQAVLTNTLQPRAQVSEGSSGEMMQPPRPQLGSTTPMMQPPRQGGDDKKHCVAVGRNIGIGARGDDVKEIQKMLAGAPESGFVGTTTGYYGPMTAEAMRRFQEHNGIASTTTGTVGPVTRGFFDRECGRAPGPVASSSPAHAENDREHSTTITGRVQM